MDIQFKAVVKAFGDQQVLADLNVQLHGGKIYGVRGRNGSGKTVFLKLLCGLLIPTAGEISIDDELLGYDRSFPKSVGALIEAPGYIGNYSGFKNLQSLAAIKNRVTREQIIAMMTLFHLDPQDKKKVKRYSLGMKQKLGLIMAFFEEPDLIILDEPLNGLDEEAVGIVRELLRAHKERGALIVIASHEQQELTSFADVIFQVANGRIEEVQK